MEKKFNRGRKVRDAQPAKPRAQRMSSEGQQRFRERGQAKEFEGESGFSGSSAARRGERKYADNVSLNLSPRMLQLAEELADESDMSLRQYLIEAIKYVLLAHGKRLGKSEKHLAEFVNENPKKISTWKADSEKPEQSDRATFSDKPQQRRRDFAGKPRERRADFADKPRERRGDFADKPGEARRTFGSKRRTEWARSESSEGAQQEGRGARFKSEDGRAKRPDWKRRPQGEDTGGQKRTWKPRASSEQSGSQGKPQAKRGFGSKPSQAKRGFGSKPRGPSKRFGQPARKRRSP